MQLGLAVLVVPLLVVSTLLVVLLIASADDRIRAARRSLDGLAARLESQRAEVTPWFANARQQLLAAEAGTESVGRGLLRLDEPRAVAAAQPSETRTTPGAVSPRQRPGTSRRLPRG